MKIVVTDCGLFWEQRASVLEQWEKEVFIISLDGKENHSSKYKCFVSPYKFIGLGIDEGKAQKSRKYQVLCSIQPLMARTG